MKRLLLTNNGRGFVRFYEYTHKDAPYFSDLTSRSTHTSVLFVHATGFHGRIYDRTISYLNPSKYTCYTYDQRGHGHSPWPDDAPQDVLTSWDGFGNDALDMSKYVYEQHDRPIIGVGHSQGATALVMAALKEPHLYKSLILYEPVIFPKLWRSLSKCFFCFSESPLAISSIKRRVEFDSRMDAFSNFAGKPPMRGFHVEVLKDYIRHGTVPCDGEEGKEDPRVRLLCDPNVEVGIDYFVPILQSTHTLLIQLMSLCKLAILLIIFLCLGNDIQLCALSRHVG